MKAVVNKSMVNQSPLRSIIKFTIPVFAGIIFQQIYNLADTVIAGRYIGTNALAAIGSTGSLIFFFIGWLNAMTGGFAILMAQSYGASDMKGLRRYVAISIYLTGVIGLLMTVVLLFANEPILRLMNTPEDIMADAAEYMYVIYAGLLVTAAYNALSSILRAVGDSRSPLYFLILSALVNVVLDIVFIVYFSTGVVGCAYATVLSQGLSVILCLIYIVKRYEMLKIEKDEWKFSFSIMLKMLALGIPMGLQNSITAAGTILVQGAINVYGSAVVAGFAAAIRVQGLLLNVFIAFGVSVATFVGQNLGAGKYKRVLEGVFRTQMLLLVLSGIIGVLIHFWGVDLAAMFLGDASPEVLSAAATYYRTVIWAYPILSAVFLYRNAIQGLGYGLLPMLGGIFELIARFLVVAFIVGPFGFPGVCFADPAAWMAATIPLVPYYYFYIRKKMLLLHQKQEQSLQEQEGRRADYN